jgi:hypothetical protein
MKTTWEAVRKISLKEAWEKFNCLYIDNHEVFITDEEDLKYRTTKLRDCGWNPAELRIYGTDETQISLDADSIIGNACDELWEEAEEHCDRDGLQKLLNAWCEEQTGTKTYHPDFSIGVIYT